MPPTYEVCRRATAARRGKQRLLVEQPGRSPVVSMAWAVALLAGCGETPPPSLTSPPPSPVNDAIVAQVGETALTRDEFEQRRDRLGTGTEPRRIVEEWIQFQATLAKARAAGHDRDPRVVAQWERFLASHYRETRWSENHAAASEISEAELLAAYERRAEEFAIPEGRRVAVLQWRMSPKTTPEKRDELAAELERLREVAVNLDDAGFADLIRRRSEDPSTRYRGGDVGWLIRDAASGHWDAAVVEAAFTLETIGAVSPILESENGLHLVRLLERRPAGRQPFDAVREALQHGLVQERRREREEQFAREMRAGLSIQINRPLIESLESLATPPARAAPALPAQ